MPSPTQSGRQQPPASENPSASSLVLEVTGGIVLEVTSGPELGRQFEFARHGNLFVGRAPCAHFRLPQDDRRVSRLHFMIEFNSPLCRLLDLGSRNGTRVNGQRVTSADLRPGVTIEAGRTEFRLLDGSRLAAVAEPFAEEPEPGSESPSRRSEPANQSDQETVEDTDVVTRQVPGYRLERELSARGMGSVYLATRLADGRQVALKTIHPAVAAGQRHMRRFVNGAGILMQLEHPHIVTYHDMGHERDFAWFAMEHVTGRNATRRVARQGPFEIERVLRIAGQMLSALEYAHAAGFVHRDLKPANVLLRGSGENETVHLTDFGLARAYRDSPLSGLSMLDDMLGTVAFMAPEQVLHSREATPGADQYAAAATLYYLLTGQHVHDFDSAVPEQCLIKALLNPHVPLQERRADVPPRLALIIDRALVRDAKARYESVSAFRKALQLFAPSVR